MGLLRKARRDRGGAPLSLSLRSRINAEAIPLFTLIASASRFRLYVTLNLFQGLVFEMLKQVQHDEVVTSP